MALDLISLFNLPTNIMDWLSPEDLYALSRTSMNYIIALQIC